MTEQDIHDGLADLREQLRVQQEQLAAQQEVIDRQTNQLLHQQPVPPQLPNLAPTIPIPSSVDFASSMIGRVGVHLPAFNSRDPQLWFALADNTFRKANITSEDTKYQYVVANLGDEFSREVKDLIINIPTVNPFSTLRGELIRRLGLSQTQRAKRLLELETLGDLKASQFLRRLKDLGGEMVTDDLIKTIWSSRLPNLVQAIIASQPSLSLDELANLADSVIETTSGPQISEVSHPIGASNANNVSLQSLLDQMQLMQKEIASIRLDDHSSRRSRSSNRGRSNQSQRTRSKTPNGSQSRSRSGLCWYHWRWGTKAAKCISPCTFSNQPSDASGTKPLNSTG